MAIQTLGEIVNGARRHEAGAFRRSRVPQTLPNQTTSRPVPSRRGTRCRRANERDHARTRRIETKERAAPPRQLRDSGDPSSMTVAGREGQPIARRSAVLVALFEEAGETHLVLTRRSFSLREHRGEIALPGGGVTPVKRRATPRFERRAKRWYQRIRSARRWMAQPIVTLALGSAIWPVIGFLTNDRHGDRSGRSRPCVHGALAELLAEGRSSKSGGDVNWLDGRRR